MTDTAELVICTWFSFTTISWDTELVGMNDCFDWIVPGGHGADKSGVELDESLKKYSAVIHKTPAVFL